MTGFRVGNPKRQRKFLQCRCCGEMRFIKARNLCETCHKYRTRDGTIDKFTPLQKQDQRRDRPFNRHVCGCFEPVISYGWCLKCDKPLRP